MEYPYMLDNCSPIVESLDECDVFSRPVYLGESQNDIEMRDMMQMEILNINLRNNY